MIYIEYIKIVINDFKTPIPYLIQAMFISATSILIVKEKWCWCCIFHLSSASFPEIQST